MTSKIFNKFYIIKQDAFKGGFAYEGRVHYTLIDKKTGKTFLHGDKDSKKQWVKNGAFEIIRDPPRKTVDKFGVIEYKGKKIKTYGKSTLSFARSTKRGSRSKRFKEVY